MKRTSNADFDIENKPRVIVNLCRFWAYKLLYAGYTCLALLAMGTSLGVVSMYFGTGHYLMPMFLSYFRVDYLPFLNIFPVVICIFLLYFIFNRVWVSFLLTAVITMGLTWINYFKLLFRNDPLLAADLSLCFESLEMAGQYDIQFNWKFYCVIAACILGTVASFYLVRMKMRSVGARLAGIVIVILVGSYVFHNIYMDSKIYRITENNGFINKWSSTQVYISKGFIYPFIYSIKANIDSPPAGYNEKQAKKILESYAYSEIPENKRVNVIAVMLEAYNDFSKFEQLKFNIDVYEYLHQLEKESYSGELVTNIFAGGTINTERCFLTGYTALNNFRYKTNSYVRYFEEQGYTVEGSHPCYSWFYNRRNVNEYLGFKNYYFFENYYSQLADGKIAKDNILFPEIIKLYEANKKTKQPYFSFNVTYQNHGPYSSSNQADKHYIKNLGYTQESYNILNNYFTGINKTNQELEAFIEYFRKENEAVVVILFGDHNPWMGDNNSVYKMLDINLDLSTEEGFYNYYNTPYIIWGNDSAKKVLGSDIKGKGPEIGPYFLMNEFFDLAGYEGNEFMKLSNKLKQSLHVVHSKNRYKESGVLTSKLSEASKKELEKFLQVQYYWRKNFKK